MNSPGDRVGAVELKLEGLGSENRIINHHGYRHDSAAAVISMIYLCCGGIMVKLLTET
jgi:transposase